MQYIIPDTYSFKHFQKTTEVWRTVLYGLTSSNRVGAHATFKAAIYRQSYETLTLIWQRVVELFVTVIAGHTGQAEHRCYQQA
jgi:hypothetical protein